MIRYNRAPSDSFYNLLKSTQIIDFLSNEIIGHDSKPLSIEFREKDHLYIYCGMTKILNIHFHSTNEIGISAESYKDQPCAKELVNKWNLVESIDKVKDLIKFYVNNVKIGESWYMGEGKIQVDYIKKYGLNWRSDRECIVFDREAVLGYEDINEKDRVFDGYKEPLARIKDKYLSNKWANIKDKKANEADLIGISSNNDLYLIEVKKRDTTSSEIYYSSYQLLRYMLEWENALRSLDKEQIINDMFNLIDKKIGLGLLPRDTIINSRVINRIVPVLAVDKNKWSQKIDDRRKKSIEIINSETNNKLKDLKIWELGA